MQVPARKSLRTVEDLYTMPEDGLKYELVAGVLVCEPLPGMRHGRVAARVAEILAAHVRPSRLGIVLTNDPGYVLARSPDTVRGPDVSFLSRERFERVGDTPRAYPGAPDLAVEIVSPSNMVPSIHAKTADYLAAGTQLVWVVDPEERQVTVYRTLLSPQVLAADELIEGGDVLPGFGVRVSEFFEL